jgi:D-3-phosphoglycerate dehydrogenase
MGTLRALIDHDLAPIVVDLFNEAKIESDVVTPREGSLEALVRYGDYSAMMIRGRTRIPAPVMEAAGSHMKVIGVVGDTLNNLSTMDATNNGVVVKMTEYGNTFEAAKLTTRLMVYMSSKSFCEHESKKSCIFKSVEEIMPGAHTGYELADKIIGLIGCGRVAQAVAKEVGPHCEKILGYDNNPFAVYRDFHQPYPLERPIIEYCQLEDIIEKADIISIHTRGDDKIVGGDDIVYSKKRPFIINTSRGGSCCDDELIAQALKDKRVQGAAFTVPESDLKKGNIPDNLKPFVPLSSVVFAPRLGKPMAVAHKKNVQALARSVIDFLLTGDLSLAVNPPDVYDRGQKDHFPMAVHDMRSSVPLKL